MSTRPASAEDVERGHAVFHIPDSRSKVYDLGFSLPAEATVATDIVVNEGEKIPIGTPIKVVQAEIVDDQDIVLGFSYDAGQGVCTLSEVRFKREAGREDIHR